MADDEEFEEAIPEIYFPPAIDDLFEVNGEILRTVGVHIREDEEEQAVRIYITLSRSQFHIVEDDIPAAFRNAFKE